MKQIEQFAQKWKIAEIFTKNYHYITCVSMDPLRWMGAVRLRLQTTHKNITLIHK